MSGDDRIEDPSASAPPLVSRLRAWRHRGGLLRRVVCPIGGADVKDKRPAVIAALGGGGGDTGAFAASALDQRDEEEDREAGSATAMPRYSQPPSPAGRPNRPPVRSPRRNEGDEQDAEKATSGSR